MAIETPTDEVEAPSKKTRKPTAANRYRLFDDGGGDYRLYEVAGVDSGLPKGALLPIPEVPAFVNTEQAKKFVNNSGDLLNGKQVLIFKGIEMCSITVQTTTQVRPKWKRRKPVTGPAAKAAEAEGE